MNLPTNFMTFYTLEEIGEARTIGRAECRTKKKQLTIARSMRVNFRWRQEMRYSDLIGIVRAERALVAAHVLRAAGEPVDEEEVPGDRALIKPFNLLSNP